MPGCAWLSGIVYHRTSEERSCLNGEELLSGCLFYGSGRCYCVFYFLPRRLDNRGGCGETLLNWGPWEMVAQRETSQRQAVLCEAKPLSCAEPVFALLSVVAPPLDVRGTGLFVLERSVIKGCCL